MSIYNSIPAFTGTVTRLTDTPLVAAGMFAPAALAGLEPDALANINGPSVLRMPDWAAGKQAAFHMYFGHHKGKSLRLAYADRLEGPWAMHPDPIIPLADSLFEPEDPAPDPTLPKPDWVRALGGDYLYAHVASPDAHIDEANRRIVMYYHGLLRNGDQQTRLATSADGLYFTPQAPLLGPPYFRATRLDGPDGGMIYLSMWEGRLGRMTSWQGPVELAPPIHDGYHLPPHVSGRNPGQPGRQIRHGHIFAHDRRLHMTFSRIGDCPERCLHCEVVPADDWADWRFGPVSDLLHPAPGWEGGDLPIRLSIMGTAWERLHELRDPALFTDNGKVYMAYCGGAESGLGIARVDGL
jgi:hypothetical protein